jgi:hypothetical protein
LALPGTSLTGTPRRERHECDRAADRVSKPTVILSKKRYAAEGTGGLEDRPKPGKPRITDDVATDGG